MLGGCPGGHQKSITQFYVNKRNFILMYLKNKPSKGDVKSFDLFLYRSDGASL